MSIFALRIFMFTLYPLLLAGWVRLVDRSAHSKGRLLEVTLVFLFGISVAGSGIFNFFAHFFLSDVVAKSIGWEPGSPFQLEVAFANLALGVLGVIATARRDGFREATVIAVTVFSFGATIVHILDIVSAGNLAPGNTIQNIGNLLRPALLIWFLVKTRQANKKELSDPDTNQLNQWLIPLLSSSGPLAITISTAYGIGFAFDQVWLYSIIGMLLGVGIVTTALSRSPLHELIWKHPSNSASQ